MKTKTYIITLLLVVGSVNSQTCEPSSEEVSISYRGVANNIPGNDILVESETGIDWADLLSPAPTAISVLSSLLMVTTAQDVSLENAGPADGWHYVQFPSSLRASTLQVANEAYYALKDAHTNMDFIRIKTGHVPIYFKEIAQIVDSGSETERKVILPGTVAKLERVAIECSELATETSNAFDTVSRLIDELVLGCQTKKGMSDAELQDVLSDLQVTTEARTNHEAHLVKFEREAEKAEKVIDEAVKKYEKAINDKPGVWEMLASSVVGLVTDTVGTVVGGIFGRPNSANPQPGTGTAEHAAVTGDMINTRLYKDGMTDMFSCGLQPKKIATLLQDGKMKEAERGARELKSKLENMHISLSSEGVPKTIIASEKKLYEQACAMLEEMLTFAKGMPTNGTEMDTLKESANDWRIEVGVLERQLNAQPGMDSMPPQSPTQAKSQSADTSISGKLMEGYRVGIEGHSALMKNAQQNADYQRERLDQAVQKSAELLAKVTRLNLQEADVRAIIDVLHAAINELTRLTQAWRKLDLFFKMIANQINGQHREKIQHFTENIEKYMQTAGPDGRFDASTDILYRMAYRASAENWRVNRMADTYVKISDEHFMPPLMNISSLLNINGKTADGRNQLQRASGVVSGQMTNTHNEIKRLIREEESNNSIKRVAYMRKLRNDIQSLCPEGDGGEQEIAAEIVKRANAKPTLDFGFGGGF